MEKPLFRVSEPFGQYMKVHRVALGSECSGESGSAAVQLGSKRFKDLSAGDKAKYENLYQEAKQQYEKDIAVFRMSSSGGQTSGDDAVTQEHGETGHTVVSASALEGTAQTHEQPKRIVGGAFGQYMKVHRSALARECSSGSGKAAQLGSKRFKELSADDKAKYEHMYQEAKQQYENDVAAFLNLDGVLGRFLNLDGY